MRRAAGSATAAVRVLPSHDSLPSLCAPLTSTISCSARSPMPTRRMQWCRRPGPSRPCAISKPRPSPAGGGSSGRRLSAWSCPLAGRGVPTAVCRPSQSSSTGHPVPSSSPSPPLPLSLARSPRIRLAAGTRTPSKVTSACPCGASSKPNTGSGLRGGGGGTGHSGGGGGTGHAADAQWQRGEGTQEATRQAAQRTPSPSMHAARCT